MATSKTYSGFTLAGLRRRAWKTFDSKEGKRLRRIKGARHAHETIRASGRVTGEEARRMHMANVERRRKEKELAAKGQAKARSGQADLTGI